MTLGLRTVEPEPSPACPIYGVDFGTGDALAIYGPTGPIKKRDLKFARVKGGSTPAMEFTRTVETLMRGNEEIPAGDIVVESPTIGSSGCEIQDVIDLLGRYPDRSLFTISARAVKNYRSDHRLGWRKGARYVRDGDTPPPHVIELYTQPDVHVEDAEIIYRIAIEHPERLYLWTGPSYALERMHTSVRPMDKRGYKDDRSEAFMAYLPRYELLPEELRDVFGNGKEYSRSMVMPFAMSMTEPHLDDGPREERRGRYEKIIGLYDRGYPSFYRRATIVVMQRNAKRIAEVTRISEVSPELRKQAWRLTQRQVRWLFHLSMAHQGR